MNTPAQAELGRGTPKTYKMVRVGQPPVVQNLPPTLTSTRSPLLLDRIGVSSVCPRILRTAVRRAPEWVAHTSICSPQTKKVTIVTINAINAVVR
jgi:hypothetical protein